MAYFTNGEPNLQGSIQIRPARALPVHHYNLKHYLIVKELLESVEPVDVQPDEVELLKLTNIIIHRIKRSRVRGRNIVRNANANKTR